MISVALLLLPGLGLALSECKRWLQFLLWLTYELTYIHI